MSLSTPRFFATLAIVLFTIIAILYTPTTYAAAPTNGLVSYWDFDETSGTTANDGIGSNDGTLVNGPTWTSGRVGNAVSLDGTNDSVDLTSAANLDDLSQMTYSFWVQRNAPTAKPTEFALTKRGAGPTGWNIALRSNGDLRFAYAWSGAAWAEWSVPAGLSAPGTFSHVVVTYDNTAPSNKPTIYINGVAQTVSVLTLASGSPIADGALNLRVGSDGSTNFLNGVIDDLLVYNRVLSASEAQSIYASAFGGTIQTCTSFTYSSWGSCSTSGTQTRTVTSASPAGCIGGTPVLTQSCTVTPLPTGVFFQDDFESGNFNHGVSSNGLIWGGNQQGSAHVSVAANIPPNPKGGGGSYAVSVPFGPDAPGVDSWRQLGGRFAAGVPDIWMQYDTWVPANYYHRGYSEDNNSGGVNNKMLSLNGIDDYAAIKGPTFIMQAMPNTWYSSNLNIGSVDSVLNLATGKNNKWPTAYAWDPISWLPGSGANATPWIGSKDRGHWARITIHAKLATSANNDGVFEVWKLYDDDTSFKFIDQHSGPYYTSTQVPFQDFYLYGWSNSGYKDSTTFYIDNFKASTAPLTYDRWSASTPPPTPDTTAPSVPTNLTLTALSSSQVSLTWTAATDNVGVTGYKIYRNGTQITTTTGTTYTDSNLAASTAYTYTVAAYDSANNTSAQSAGKSVTTQSGVAVSTKFSINARVQVFTGDGSNLSVRTTANGTLAGQQSDLAPGTVIGGPTAAGSYIWWNVNFDSGVDGWVSENFIRSYVVTYACSDGVDNDSDSLIDLNDPGCSSTTDNDEYNAPTTPTACTYTTSNWSACSVSGTQTRTYTASPSGCTGTPPSTTQSCTYTPAASTKFTIGNQVQTTATLNVRSTPNGTSLGTQPPSAIGTVIGGPTYNSGYNWWNVTFQSAPNGWAAEDWLTTYTAPNACTYSYSTWGACQSSNTQVRTLISSLPYGCSGTPVTIQACTYVPSTSGGGGSSNTNSSGGSSSGGSSSGGSSSNTSNGGETNNSSNTTPDRTALLQRIAELQVLITQLTAQMNGTTPNPTYRFTKYVTIGDDDPDVLQLQKKLNQHGFTIATEGAGAPGNETSYYGPRTTEAIKRFQCQYNIVCGGSPWTNGYGNFGPQTRERLSEL